MIKVGVWILLVGIAIAAKETPTWDVAVAVTKQIALLNNGTVSTLVIEEFNNIKALAYNYNSNTFIVADKNGPNDTIYFVNEKTMKSMLLIDNLVDDIKSIAFDPVTETVFWTDSAFKNINYKSVRDTSNVTEYNTLFNFEEEIPQAFVIDSCQRMIYWTNTNYYTPTIEKSTIMGTERQVIVKTDIHMPSAIAIDHLEQRIYWADKLLGIYFRIESVDFDGNDRQVLFEGTHRKPSFITVDKDYVYWTDFNNDGVWRKKKFTSEDPILYHNFDSIIGGITTRYAGFPEEPNCDKLAMLIQRKHEAKENEKVNAKVYVPSENKTCPVCLHGKQEENSCTCICESGYTGPQCNIDVCFNYCSHGDCWVNEGQPHCECTPGFSGVRCEKNICDNYCLHGGVCEFTTKVQCKCPKGFSGTRCETLVPVPINYDLCKDICMNSSESNMQEEKPSLCSCSNPSYMPLETNNATQSLESSVCEDISNMFQYHPVVGMLIAGNLLMLVISLTLVIYICKMKKVRPRIKKRVVVNKNITPLTYRPQAVEQCEITIEDCCNMNICETPCFEPRIEMKKDEKKTLLDNIEKNEEFY